MDKSRGYLMYKKPLSVPSTQNRILRDYWEENLSENGRWIEELDDGQPLYYCISLLLQFHRLKNPQRQAQNSISPSSLLHFSHPSSPFLILHSLRHHRTVHIMTRHFQTDPLCIRFRPSRRWPAEVSGRLHRHCLSPHQIQ